MNGWLLYFDDHGAARDDLAHVANPEDVRRSFCGLYVEDGYASMEDRRVAMVKPCEACLKAEATERKD